MTSQTRQIILGTSILVGLVILYVVISRVQSLNQSSVPNSTPIVSSATSSMRTVSTVFPTSVPFVTVTPRGWWPSPTPIGWMGFGEGKAAPDFTLIGLDGKSHKLSDYRDKRIILNFWASWCAPCRIEAPLLQTTYDQLADKENIVVIGINMREDNVAANRFVEQFKWIFPILLDSDALVSETYSVLALPTTFFIDGDGILRFRQLGPLSDGIIQSNLDAMPSTAMHSDSHSD